MERRAFEIAELRIEQEEGKPTKIGGYAAVFNSESVDLGGFVERIAPGAFAGAAGADVRALLNHNPDVVLGRTKSGTLRLTEDSRGLAFDLDLPDTQAGRDLAVSIYRRDISGMSFAFRTIKDAWAKLAGVWHRTLLEVNLLDVSPVTFPAYPAAEVGLRAASDAKDALAGLERAKALEVSRERRLRLLERESA
jgi:Escherichia/Staphylococcus phage prohead protease